MNVNKVHWIVYGRHRIIFKCIRIYVSLSRMFQGVILSLQSISGDVADNVSHPRRQDPTMELVTYSFVLYLQHGRHDVKCKPSNGCLLQLLNVRRYVDSVIECTFAFYEGN